MGVNKFYPEQMNIQQFIHPLGPAGGSTPMNIAPWILLTHWGRYKMAAIFPDDTFKRIFLNENIIISIKISLKFVPKGPINNCPSLV